jgi:DNA mismatch repair protein PMS2
MDIIGQFNLGFIICKHIGTEALLIFD